MRAQLHVNGDLTLRTIKPDFSTSRSSMLVTIKAFADDPVRPYPFLHQLRFQ